MTSVGHAMSVTVLAGLRRMLVMDGCTVTSNCHLDVLKNQQLSTGFLRD